MDKRIGMVVFVLFLSTFLWAGGGGDYAVAKINPVLMKNANAVLRIQESRFQINSTKDARYIDHYVVTILNENADEWSALEEYYDKYRTIESVEGVLYDGDGKVLKRMKTKDLEDLSAVSGLMSDSRIKRHNFYYKVYPYTIEYTVEYNYKSTLFFPLWAPQEKELLSVEKATTSIVCPAGYQFRYKASKYKGDPVVTQEKGNNITTWTIQDVPAIQRESFSPAWLDIITYVKFGPTDFQVEDYKGNMVTWQDFGKFVYSLKQGRDQLPENVKQAVHQVINGITDPKEIVTRLYEYMQKNTRYISVQLGIGGWQPFDATYVALKGYGDCKALANYMYSLLEEAGIPSNYTIIKAGLNKGKIVEDFPSQQFDHVILCVPLKKDTMWLECTDQTLPAGYLGEFTNDRYALLIDQDGGKLIRTPRYGLKENLEIRHISGLLDNEATLHIKSASSYSCLQQDDYHDLINRLSRDKVKEVLHSELDFATYEINNFEYKETKSALPIVNETLDITVDNYATITGKRLFIMPNVMTRTHRRLSADSLRKFDIDLGYAFNDVDSVEISLPDGYSAESMPRDVSITNKFGKYDCSVKLSGNKIMYYRNIEQKGGRFPATDYSDLVQFYETIYKADRNKVVLVKNDAPAKAF